MRLEGGRVREVEVGEICNDIRHTESRDHPHNASNEDVEDPRPVKRRKLPTTPIERLTSQVSQPNSAAATQPKTNKARVQASYEYAPTFVDDTRDRRCLSVV